MANRWSNQPRRPWAVGTTDCRAALAFQSRASSARLSAASAAVEQTATIERVLAILADEYQRRRGNRAVAPLGALARCTATA